MMRQITLLLLFFMAGIAAELKAQHQPPSNKNKEEQQAYEKALQIHKELLMGADFAEMARKYSDDPGTRELGGEVGYTEQGMLLPAYEGAALVMSEGEFSGPVKTQFGYHIIQLIGIQENKFNTRHILIRYENAHSAGDQE